MRKQEEGAPWAIVLAAGDGTRLRDLTTDRAGRSVPKQFCSLRGGSSLLGEALERGRAVTRSTRVMTIVARQHERFWRRELDGLEAPNVIVQPRNRGTAAGLLLPLLVLLERDPEAHVIILPSDHHVGQEAVLGTLLRGALQVSRRKPDEIVLLGIVPGRPEPEYGWILPAQGPTRTRLGARRVARFVEKPPVVVAAQLLEAGGLWNSFILAARGRALLGLYERTLPGLIEDLRGVFARPRAERGSLLERLYARLESNDFCRDVLQACVDALWVVEVPACDWTDLGTPHRVQEVLERGAPRRRAGHRDRPAVLDLERALAETGAAVRASRVEIP